MTLEESVGMETFDPRLLSDTALPLDSLDMDQAREALAWCDEQLAMWKSATEVLKECWGKAQAVGDAMSRVSAGYPDPCWTLAMMLHSTAHQHACAHDIAAKRVKELEHMRASLAESIGMQ